MLRLLDARTGSYAEARPAVPGVLRVLAHVADAAPGIDLTGLRVLLTADLLARTAELRGIQTFTMFASTSRFGGQVLTPEAGALGIHPPTGYAGQWADIDLAAAGNRAGSSRPGILVEVAPARPTATGNAAVLADSGPGSQPASSLGLRLALMYFPYHQPAEVSASMLASAGQTLSEWRHRVAEWAESPSRPMPRQFSDQIREAEYTLLQVRCTAGSAVARLRRRYVRLPLGCRSARRNLTAAGLG